ITSAQKDELARLAYDPSHIESLTPQQAQIILQDRLSPQAYTKVKKANWHMVLERRLLQDQRMQPDNPQCIHLHAPSIYPTSSHWGYGGHRVKLSPPLHHPAIHPHWSWRRKCPPPPRHSHLARCPKRRNPHSHPSREWKKEEGTWSPSSPPAHGKREEEEGNGYGDRPGTCSDTSGTYPYHGRMRHRGWDYERRDNPGQDNPGQGNPEQGNPEKDNPEQDNPEQGNPDDGLQVHPETRRGEMSGMETHAKVPRYPQLPKVHTGVDVENGSGNENDDPFHENNNCYDPPSDASHQGLRRRRGLRPLNSTPSTWSYAFWASSSVVYLGRQRREGRWEEGKIPGLLGVKVPWDIHVYHFAEFLKGTTKTPSHHLNSCTQQDKEEGRGKALLGTNRETGHMKRRNVWVTLEWRHSGFA
ncbi:hypothetical protein BJ684DRAFT_15443, partial [Piptocephalis cylindrospora]